MQKDVMNSCSLVIMWVASRHMAHRSSYSVNIRGRLTFLTWLFSPLYELNSKPSLSIQRTTLTRATKTYLGLKSTNKPTGQSPLITTHAWCVTQIRRRPRATIRNGCKTSEGKFLRWNNKQRRKLNGLAIKLKQAMIWLWKKYIIKIPQNLGRHHMS